MGPAAVLNYYIICGLGGFFLHSCSWGLTNNVYGTFFPAFDQPAGVSNQLWTMQLDAEFGRVVGASGAVFGILLAFGMLFPNTRLMLLFPPIPIKAKYFVIGYGILELSLAWTMRPVTTWPILPTSAVCCLVTCCSSGGKKNAAFTDFSQRCGMT